MKNQTVSRLSGQAAAIVACVMTGALGCASNASPQLADIRTALLESDLGQHGRIEEVQRVNGVDYPAGNGSAHRYEIQYAAIVIPSGRVTIRISSPVESALGQDSSMKGVLIKGVDAGHKPDPKGLDVFFDIGTSLFRADESQPVPIEGNIAFLKTENGWQSQNHVMHIAESMAASIRTSRRLIGEWYGGVADCLKIESTGANTLKLSVKSWYCEAGEPDSGVVVTIEGTEARGPAAIPFVRWQADKQIVVSGRHAPPNDHILIENQVFRKRG